MFDTSSHFYLVQIRKNKLSDSLASEEYIYKFFMKNNLCRVKYLVNFIVYPNQLIRIDFYPKINSDNKYRLLTNQFKFGTIGGTLLKIMNDFTYRTGINTFGMLCAQTLKEMQMEQNHNTKCLKVYKGVLSRTLDPTVYSIYENSTFSTIFVIPNIRLNDKKDIILYYGKIFEENH